GLPAAVPRPAVAAARVRGRRAVVVGEALGGAVSRRGGRLGGAGRARAGRARPARRPRPARAGVPCRGGLGAAGPRAPAAPPAPPPVPPGRIRRRSARQKTAVRPVRGLNTPSEPNRQGGTTVRPPATPRERSGPEPAPENTSAPVSAAGPPEGPAPERSPASESLPDVSSSLPDVSSEAPGEPRESASHASEALASGEWSASRSRPSPESSSPAHEPVTDLSDLPPVWSGRRALAAWPLVPLAVALALWGYAVRHTDVSALDDFGLVTALHPAFWAGLAVLTAGFWLTVRDPRSAGGWPAAYVLGLLVMERATQAVLYPTPLYAWAWKHDGVVDHLLTAGGLQTAAEVGDMAVYDQWPGFFAAQAALVRLLGVDSAAMYMAWWPLASSLMLLLPLLLIYRTFTEDRRLIWTGVWLFFVANWVGQDYFSPQSVAFALHLGVLAVVLRRYGRSGGARRRGQAVWTAVIVVMVTAIVISHQLTPGMLVVSLLALCLLRRHRDWVPAVTTVVIFLAWCLTAALPFLSAAMPDMI